MLDQPRHEWVIHRDPLMQPYFEASLQRPHQPLHLAVGILHGAVAFGIVGRWVCLRGLVWNLLVVFDFHPHAA